MASGNKPTAVHFTLIVFVMISLIAGVVAYMNIGELQAKNVEMTTLQNDLKTARDSLTAKNDDIQALKTVIGKMQEDVRGNGGPADQNAVVPAAKQDMATLLGGLNVGNYTEALQKARAELNTLTQERNTLQATVNDLNARINALQAQMQVRVDAFQKQATDAEAGHRKEIADKEEAIRGKDQEINAVRTDLTRVQSDFDLYKDQMDKQTATLRKDYDRLVAINDRLRSQLDEVTKINFEHPDGEIEWADYQSGLVWINLGSADVLPVGTTFSVYTKAHHGVGRGSEDIKGAIEVTRVLDAHRAEARIVKDDPSLPISKGDPVYTPLWSPGRREAIAVIGTIDLDGDGQSDRELFHEKVAGAGAVIDLEVDDQGNEVGEGFTVNTKFLVKGELADPTKTTNEKEAKLAEKILELNLKLEKETRLRGIRTISLNDFLSHIGYKPERRNWRPGEERPYNLKYGAQSKAANETIGNRAAAGTVSGAFRKRVGPAKSSTGQTSKIFK